MRTRTEDDTEGNGKKLYAPLVMHVMSKAQESPTRKVMDNNLHSRVNRRGKSLTCCTLFV